MHFVKESVYFIEENFVEDFIELETGCWDSWLAEQPGLIHKQILIDSDNPNLVTVQVTWESAEKMSNLDLDDMVAIQEEFEQEVSDNNYAFELIKTDYFYTHNSIDNRLEIKLGGPGSGRRPSGVAPKAKPESTGKRGRPKKNNPEPAGEQDSGGEGGETPESTGKKEKPKSGKGTAKKTNYNQYGYPGYTLDTALGPVEVPPYLNTDGGSYHLTPKKITQAEVLHAVLTKLHPTRTPVEESEHRNKLLGVLNNPDSKPQAKGQAVKAISKYLAIEEEAKKQFPEVYAEKKSSRKTKAVEIPEYQQKDRWGSDKDQKEYHKFNDDVEKLSHYLQFKTSRSVHVLGGLTPSTDAVSQLLKDPTVPLKTKNKIAAIKSRENAVEAAAAAQNPTDYAKAVRKRDKAEGSAPANAKEPSEPKTPKKPRKSSGKPRKPRYSVSDEVGRSHPFDPKRHYIPYWLRANDT